MSVCNIHDFDKLWAHPFSYDDFNATQNPEVEYASKLHFGVAGLDKTLNLDVLKRAYDLTVEEANNESCCMSLLCDETLPSSVMNCTLVSDVTFEICEEKMDSTEKPKNDTNDEEPLDKELDSIAIDTRTGSNNTDILEGQQSTSDQQITPIATTSLQGTNMVEPEIHTVEHTSHMPCQNSIGTTKSGKPRMRRKFEESLETRLEEKKRMKLEKMGVKPGCNDTCSKKCTSSFDESERKRINEIYQSLSHEAQGLYVKSLVAAKEVNRRIRESQQLRKHTYEYFLDISDKKKEVCKTFFLTTLGYNKNNDKRVLNILSKPPEAQKDQRGKHHQSNHVDREKLRQHIETYRPAVAHYRRAHAPNRRYLPSDLNAVSMHSDFKEKNPEVKVSYELYRKFLKHDMNISFAQLGNEEC